MRKVEMLFIGCDDETYMEMVMTDSELEFLKRLEKLSKENSEYSCQPILEITSIDGVEVKKEKNKPNEIIF